MTPRDFDPLMDEAIPTAVWEGSVPLFGVQVRCYVLDNGQRILNADDVWAVFQAMGDGVVADPNDITEFVKWWRAPVL